MTRTSVMASVTENTRIPFGTRHRGRKLKAVPDSYLQWLVANVWDSDLHEWAVAAQRILSSRTTDQNPDLEKAADDFLLEHGFDKHGKRHNN